MLTEGMLPDQRKEVDDILEGTTPATAKVERTKRASELAQVGGQVVAAGKRLTQNVEELKREAAGTK